MKLLKVLNSKILSKKEKPCQNKKQSKFKKKMVRSFYGQIEDFAKHVDDEDAKALSNAIAKRFYAKSTNSKEGGRKSNQKSV